MKVNTKKLYRAMVILTRFTQKNHSYLGSVYLSFEYSRLSLYTSTMLGYGVTVKLPATGNFNFPDVCVNALTLKKRVAKNTSESVDLSVVDGKLVISDLVTTEFDYTVSASDFSRQLFPLCDIGKPKKFTNKYIKRFFSDIVTFASTDETRRHICCVHFTDYNNKSTAISTNGHCMSVMSFDHGSVMPHKDIPAPFLKKTSQSMVNKGDCELYNPDGFTVLLTEDNLGNHYTFWAEDPDVKFPSFEKVIPSTKEYTVKVFDSCQLSELSKAIGANSDHENKPLVFHRVGNSFCVCNHAEDSVEVIKPIGEFKGDGSEFPDIELQTEYMIQAIKVLDSNELTLDFIDNLDPVVIRDPRSENFVLIMPVRL